MGFVGAGAGTGVGAAVGLETAATVGTAADWGVVGVAAGVGATTSTANSRSVVAPVESFARMMTLWIPAVSLDVSHWKRYGAWVTAPSDLSSTRSSTC